MHSIIMYSMFDCSEMEILYTLGPDVSESCYGARAML